MSVSLKPGDGSFADMLRADYQGHWEQFGGANEIEEEDYSNELFDNTVKVFKPMESIKEEVESGSESSSFDFRLMGANVVYVAVRKKSLDTSMDALKWVLNNTVIASYTTVMLIHVYPEIKFIPSLLGNLPVSQVNPEQKKIYMTYERHKRKELLQKYLDVCSKSQVKADTIEVESDKEDKAILDLIPILNIRKLVLGIKKSNARRLKSSKKGKGVTELIVHNAPESCDVKLICEGKEMTEPRTMDIASPSSSPGGRGG